MKVKVLYISYDGMTDPLGQSQVLPYLGKLSEHYDIHLLSTEKEANYEKHKDTIQAICNNFNIDWHTISYTKTPPVVSTIKDILKLRKTALKLHKEHGFEIIHCRSYIAGLIGLEMKRKFESKFLFDMRGFWADERVDGNIWNLKIPIFKFIYNYFKKKEIEFFQQADYTISLTEAGKKEILSWESLKSNPPKIEVIPCCADLDFFSPDNVDNDLQASFRKELNINENDYIISYLGSIGTWYMLNEMLDFFKVLKQQKKNARFLFITKDNPENIIQQANDRGINHLDIIIRGAERSELPSLVTLSNVSIFFILPAYSKIASSPTKQAELFGLGIPVICNDNVGDTGPVVKENQAGMVISEFNEKTYEQVISKIDEIDSIDTEHLRKVAKSYASLEKGYESYKKVYRLCLNSDLQS